MPLITLDTNKDVPPAKRHALAAALVELTAHLLRKDPKVAVVRIKGGDEDTAWTVGDSPQAADQTIFTLAVYVTRDSNTREEKDAWLRHAWEIASEHLDAGQAPNYIAVHEVDPASWGYNGLSQQHRQTSKSVA